jgi:hypothetical protein
MLGPIGPTAFIQAQSGFELLGWDGTGEVTRYLVVAWAVTAAGVHHPGCIAPIAFGGGSTFTCDDEGYSLSLPDGGVMTVSAALPFYLDVETWRASANKDAATQAWAAADLPVAGKA